jgi:hypothetical protein
VGAGGGQVVHSAGQGRLRSGVQRSPR